jgi:D-lactate dehydrogenase (cytochrome)
MEEYNRGKALYMKWAQWVVSKGGSISAEHGIGKLKRDMLRLMYGDAGIQAMQAVKRAFDPLGRLNPGNLFEAAG